MCHAGKVAECARRAAERGQELRVRSVVRSGSSVRPHHDDPVLIAHGQFLHEHRSKDGEHRHRCADASAENDQGRDEESRGAAEANAPRAGHRHAHGRTTGAVPRFSPGSFSPTPIRVRRRLNDTRVCFLPSRSGLLCGPQGVASSSKRPSGFGWVQLPSPEADCGLVSSSSAEFAQILIGAPARCGLGGEHRALAGAASRSSS